jgi:hypothetical protein
MELALAVWGRCCATGNGSIVLRVPDSFTILTVIEINGVQFFGVERLGLSARADVVKLHHSKIT